jgi:hypothetical protein
MTLGTLSTLGNLSIKLNMARSQVLFWTKFFPRDVKSALCLLVNLFLEQPKVKDKDSNIHDSLMKLIKTSAVNEGLHANSFEKVSNLFCKVIEFISYIFFK